MADRSSLLAVALTVALGGCGEGLNAPGEGPAELAEASSSMPPIYVDLLEEELHKGENSERRNYRAMLKRCQNAGFPTTPLSAAQIERLGTKRVQLWFEPGREVMRAESWVFQVGEEGIGTCHFQLIRSGDQSHNDTHASRGIDLETGEVTDEPPQAHLFNRFPVEEDDSLEQVAAEQGLAAPVTRTVAGALCTQWTDPRFFGRTICLWAEGRAWGFHDTDPGSACGKNYGHRIVLSEEPLSGSGCRITTRRLSVGRPISPDDYAPGSATGAGR